eukprot:g46418.t1
MAQQFWRHASFLGNCIYTREELNFLRLVPPCRGFLCIFANVCERQDEECETAYYQDLQSEAVLFHLLCHISSFFILAPFSARPQQEQAKQPKHEKLFLSFSADFDAQEQD